MGHDGPVPLGFDIFLTIIVVAIFKELFKAVLTHYVETLLPICRSVLDCIDTHLVDYRILNRQVPVEAA